MDGEQKIAIKPVDINATSAIDPTQEVVPAVIDNLIPTEAEKSAAIIDPKSSFCIGLDYRIPALHGLIDAKFV